MPQGITSTDLRRLGFDVDSLIGVSMRLSIPVDAEPGRFKKLFNGNAALTAMGTLVWHLVVAASPATMVAPPGPTKVLRLTLATVDRAKPVEGNPGRFPNQPVYDDLCPRGIFPNGDIGIARRAFIAPITRAFLFRTIALLRLLRLGTEGIKRDN